MLMDTSTMVPTVSCGAQMRSSGELPLTASGDACLGCPAEADRDLDTATGVLYSVGISIGLWAAFELALILIW